MKKKLIFSALIIFAVALIVGAYFIFVAPKSLGAGEKTVSLEITAGGEVFNRQIKTDKETVFEMLLELESEIELEYNTDWGAPFVTGLLGVSAEGNFWYAFFLNGESSMVGVSEAVIADGDTVSFLLTESWTPEYVEAESGLWIFFEITGLLACMGLMVYMIARDEH